MNISSEILNEMRLYGQIIQEFKFYFGATIGPVGVVLNAILVFVFFARPDLNKKINMGLICGTIALADFVCQFLMIFLFYYLLPSLGLDIINQSDLACTIGLFSVQTSSQFGAWLHVILCIERFMFVNYPNKRTLFATKRKVTYLMILALLISILINSPNLATRIPRYPTVNGTVASGFCALEKPLEVVMNNIAFVFRTILPSVVMAVLNYKTVRALLRSRTKVTGHLNGGPSKAQKRRQRRFTIAVVALNTFFVLFYLPLGIFFLWSTYEELTGIRLNPAEELLRQLIAFITAAIATVYQSFTFFIYFAFNQLFRRELLFCLKIKKNSVHSNSQLQTANFNHS
nr:G protein-coupled receptor [Proales similis]